MGIVYHDSTTDVQILVDVKSAVLSSKALFSSVTLSKQDVKLLSGRHSSKLQDSFVFTVLTDKNILTDNGNKYINRYFNG